MAKLELEPSSPDFKYSDPLLVLRAEGGSGGTKPQSPIALSHIRGLAISYVNYIKLEGFAIRRYLLSRFLRIQPPFVVDEVLNGQVT